MSGCKLFVSIVLAFALSASLPMSGRDVRSPFFSAYKVLNENLPVVQVGGGWFPYPEYSDRSAWDSLAGEFKGIARNHGNKYLNYQWRTPLASEYLSIESTGSRKYAENDSENRSALNCLVAAELVEGKGRYMRQIIDGVYMFSNMPTWQLPMHTNRQSGGRNLPYPGERYISLGAADIAGVLAIAYHFFRKEFDAVDPTINKTLLDALDRNIFGPYLECAREVPAHWWMGLGENSGRTANNWGTYCNFGCTLAFLLACNDQKKLDAALEKSFRIEDAYMDRVGMDGACNEGPSYWNMAGGKLYEYVRMISDATGGSIDLMGDAQLRNICEWKSRTFLGDGWNVCYGDGEAHNRGDIYIPFRMGVDMNDAELINYSLYLAADVESGCFTKKMVTKNHLYRALEQMRYWPRFVAAGEKALACYGGDMARFKTSVRGDVESSWYGDTQTAVLRCGTWILAPKGGNNNESHNHNDVGSAILMVKDCPVLVDLGVGTYGDKTFDKSVRYTTGHGSSDWHGVPKINGCRQSFGAGFAASGTACDVRNAVFSTDIAGAYPSSAEVSRWTRKYALSDHSLVIRDEFALRNRKEPDVVNFILQGRPFIAGEIVGGYKVRSGEVIIAARNFQGDRKIFIRMTYPSSLAPSVTRVDLEDKRLTKVWGDTIYRLSLSGKADAPVEGRYEYILKEKIL